MTHAQSAVSKPTSRDTPYLSVVFTFLNEAEVLPELVARMRRMADMEIEAGHLAGYELIFVNDASIDASEHLLQEMARERNDIRLITMSRRFGIATCTLAGMERARGDIVIYMDSDLQDPPEVIPDMLRAWREDQEIEVVHTIRQSRDGESWIKLFITKLGYRILRATSTVDLPIEAGDFKLLSRRVAACVVQMREKRPFLRGLVSWVGFRSTCIKYHREERFAGRTKYPILSRDVISNFLDSALISFSDIPLKLAIVAGVLCWLATLLYIVWIVVLRLLGHNLPGWSAIMVTILFLGGFNMLSVGVVGLYVNSIYIESKKRPNYIIKDEYGFAEDVGPESR